MRANPDGCTLLFAPISTMVINPAIYQSLPYDTPRDFAPVALIGSTNMVLVASNQFPARTISEAISLLQKTPEKFHAAHQGVGSLTHLSLEMLKTLANLKIAEVPYKGGGAATIDLIADRVSIMFDTLTAANPQIKSNAIRALGIWSKTRSTVAPDLPTLAEAGISELASVEAVTWGGLFAPANTSSEIIERLNSEWIKNSQKPEIKAKFVQQDIEMYPPMRSDEFCAFVEQELVKWDKVAAAAGIKGTQKIGN
jgi:tripartite-type tricarboxylate transporter receptor subunit TctC